MVTVVKTFSTRHGQKGLELQFISKGKVVEFRQLGKSYSEAAERLYSRVRAPKYKHEIKAVKKQLKMWRW